VIGPRPDLRARQNRPAAYRINGAADVLLIGKALRIADARVLESVALVSGRAHSGTDKEMRVCLSVILAAGSL
jgi:hypothetical protein